MGTMRQDDREFLAPKPAKNIRAAQRAAACGGHFGQHTRPPVAGRVPMCIVHLLEMVDVDRGAAQRVAMAPGRLTARLASALNARRDRKASQKIGLRLLTKLDLIHRHLRQIGEDPSLALVEGPRLRLIAQTVPIVCPFFVVRGAPA